MSQARWLERAVDALDVSLLLVGPDRTIVYANAAAHRLFGLNPGQQLSGQGIERLVVPERRGELRNIEAVLSGGGTRKVRSVMRREDGSRLDVTMVLEPCLDDDAGVSGVSVRYYEAPHSSVRPGNGASMPPLGMGQGAFGSLLPSGHPASPVPAPSDTARSQSRLAPARASDGEQRARLSQLLKNLEWLDERLGAPASIAPLDDPRERARALLVIGESLGLCEESINALGEDDGFPAAPRMPRV